MGRRKRIERDDILAAVEAVIQEAGPAALTVEAVARKAGISKASVLYDFKTKKQLLAAYVSQQIEMKTERRAEQAAQGASCGHSWLCALLEEARIPPSEEEIYGAVQLTASMGSDDSCRAQMRQFFDAEIDRIRDETDTPRQALLAWLALQGVMSLEYLGFHRFDAPLREQILDDIRRLVSPDPAPALTPASGPEHPPGS
ncbi:TetR/AcrR family transcriptional regulator [Pseudodonghicola flavimaris]|uniref:TetR/AcrR family transcriptional regulator n=1 Tax=Pseudodonghicola flavimaris TaxID=3050036 RepID=A0ABT7F800_9RHOB|nr:TetR/AcrR family transcriptional regulator [Pseudodonghicola flavimaris]MDK3020739.1 TetR/AcrR family transcriptional regulator [Pseudodonghicola flavimaris]